MQNKNQYQARISVSDITGARYVDRALSKLTPKEVGLQGEDIACWWLEHNGYKVLCRNWTCFCGEVDIVAQDTSNPDRVCLCLIEVKTRIDRTGLGRAVPEVRVDRRKRDKYLRLMNVFVTQYQGSYDIRFDVVAVQLISQDTAQLSLFVNAAQFDADCLVERA